MHGLIPPIRRVERLPLQARRGIRSTSYSAALAHLLFYARKRACHLSVPSCRLSRAAPSRHTLKMLEIASLLLAPDSSLWLLRMRMSSQTRSFGGPGHSSRGVFGDMLRIACVAFPAYRRVLLLARLFGIVVVLSQRAGKTAPIANAFRSHGRMPSGA